MAWKVEWRVTIDGWDVSSNMRPYLQAITVVDKDGVASDTCNLTFDDTGGQCLLPAVGAKVVVYLQGVKVFEGVVDSTPWTMTRGGGRILDVNAKGFDTRGKAKEAQLWHLDDRTLQDALGNAAKKAGLSGIVIDPEFASIVRSYWSPDGASFLGWGQKLAREMGATFKIRNDRAVFAKRGQGTSATGSAMPTVTGTIPGNVLSVSIDPSKGRPRYSKARVRFFDRASAQFKTKEVDVESGDVSIDVIDDVRGLTAADEGQAESMAKGRKSDSDREAGDGSVEIDLAVEAQAEGTFVLTGARPGIDGTYRIVSVTHKATRSGGATTSLELKQPSGSAGTDSRAPAP
jgi:hypothetical protein